MNEAAALPSPAVLLSARLDRDYGRLRRPPRTPSPSRLEAGYRTGRSDRRTRRPAGPGRASPVPIATFSTFHAPYAGRFLRAAIQDLHPFHGLRREYRGSAPPDPAQRRAPNDAAGVA